MGQLKAHELDHARSYGRHWRELKATVRRTHRKVTGEGSAATVKQAEKIAKENAKNKAKAIARSIKAKMQAREYQRDVKDKVGNIYTGWPVK